MQAPAAPVEVPSLPRIEEVKCESAGSGKPRVFIHFNKPLDEAFVDRLSRVESSGGVLTLRLPAMSAADFTKDCFGGGDLSVGTDGRVELKTDKSGRVMSLRNPDRLLIILD